MKSPRVDSFIIAASKSEIAFIQGIMLKHKHLFKECNDKDAANAILDLYAKISYDEGYRKAIKELDETFSFRKISQKRRKSNVFHYLDAKDFKKTIMFCRKRIDSKRQLKAREKYCKENGLNFCYEEFVVSMVIHTFFEAGYLKASSIDDQIKLLQPDESKQKMLKSIFNQLVKDFS